MVVGDGFTLFDNCRPHSDAALQLPLDPTSPFLVGFDIVIACFEDGICAWAQYGVHTPRPIKWSHVCHLTWHFISMC